MQLPVPRRVVLAVVAFGLVVLTAVPIALHSRLTAAVASGEVARQNLVAAHDTAVRERASADSALRLAHIAVASRDSAVARADSLAQHAAKQRGSFAVVAKSAPDTCRIVVASADSALAAQDSVIATQTAALQSAHDATALMQVSLDTTRAALSRMVSASVPATQALARIEKITNPGVIRRVLALLTPHVGLGTAAGVDASGKPNAVIGVTFGLSF